METMIMNEELDYVVEMIMPMELQLEFEDSESMFNHKEEQMCVEWVKVTMKIMIQMVILNWMIVKMDQFDY
ncbi:MAG: hypothetical protein EZS28_019858 [Streblomastix strix]|uniref:Uncharacterized protein n=1 Tax=Streblomastix strix TaxID=222440 RepID=A0A5J4VQS6_9EUKA|nr:MAG: hypothetical protein EZS28_019858 [Streblomastix strix]